MAQANEPDLASFRAALARRLEALSRAQEIASPSGGEVLLGKVLAAALEPLTDPHIDFGAIEECEAAPDPARSLVLAFRELATNALKSGSLTVDCCKVEVALSGCEDGPVRLERLSRAAARRWSRRPGAASAPRCSSPASRPLLNA